MDRVSNKTGYGFNFGYIDSHGLEISLASGNKSNTYLPIQVPGAIEPIDTMILGSGTKGFTATAVMQLVDQGKIHLDDPAYLYVDGPLTKAANTTMEELFGERAKNITVHNLIFMQSGL